MYSLGAIVAALKDGEVVAYPTEGVWGIGCDPSNEEALKKLISLKKRSKGKGFILIGSELLHFKKYAEVEVNKTKLMSKWPGPHMDCPCFTNKSFIVWRKGDNCIEVKRTQRNS